MNRLTPIHRLKTQIYLGVTGVVLFVSLFFSLFLYFVEQQRYETFVETIGIAVNHLVNQYESALANELFMRHDAALRLIAEEMLNTPGVLGVALFRAPAEFLFRTGDAPVADESRPFVYPDPAQPYLMTRSAMHTQPILVYTKPIRIIGEVSGYIRVYYTLADVVQKTRREIGLFIALLLTLLLAILLLINYLLNYLVIRPVVTLTDTMKAVQAGNLGQQVTIAARNEIGVMAQAFNHMSADNARMYHAAREANFSLEQKVSERTLQLEQAKDAAEAANRAKSAFLANMSHELRTPLNGILGYAQLLAMDTNIPDKEREYAAVINRSGQYLLELINDILDLAKVEAGKVELHPEDFALRDHLKELSTLIQVRTERKGLAFQLEIASDVPDRLHGDPHRLRQILLNLLGNAVKFTERGRVTLRVTSPLSLPQNLTPTLPEREGVSPLLRRGAGGEVCIRFEIRDTGIGIAPDDLSRIFEPFHQVGASQYRQQGTGLGLAITEQLIALMGGELHVSSVPGEGSAFWFDVALPVAQTEAASQSQPAWRIVGLAGTPLTALVVDDHAENRHLLREMLTPLGFVVVTAENGEEALRSIQAAPPAVVITDLHMPKMSGTELIRQIRQASDWQHIVVIATSASVYQEDQQQGFDAGCQAFLPKPIRYDKLLELLQAFVAANWEYHDSTDSSPSPEPGDAAVIIPPPPDVLRELLEACMIGDVLRINQIADDLTVRDACYAPAAEQVLRLSKAYQMSQLLELAEQWMQADACSAAYRINHED